MNLPDSWTWAELRRKFVLTPEEKRVISFVIAAFFLGLGTKCYRDAHPQTQSPPKQKQLHPRKAQP